ncbi:MAG: C25 family cysteine peptidase [candidate division WOR-3 bacterium]|nr:C25 family cysteine peptidase [candidate division WOR-3 bacterium]
MLKKIASIILAIGFAHIVFADVTHNVYFSSSDLTFRQEKGYDIVELKGCNLMDVVGEPMLSVRYMNLIIPAGNKVSRIEFPLANSQNIGTYNIYPAQPPIPVSSSEPPEWVEPDPLVYSSDEPYPGKLAEVVHEGYFNGNKIVMLAVYPLQWMPSTGELVLYDHIQLRLVLESSSETPVYPQIMTEQSYKLYKSALSSLIANDKDKSAYGYEPTVVTPQSAPAEFILPASSTEIIEYMIITPNALTSSFNSFVEWLWKKGIRAGIITVEDILASYPGVDDAQKVKRCIWKWWQFNSLTYVLLAGDDGIVPFRYGWARNNLNFPPQTRVDSFYIIPTDLYFSDLSGNWDVDGDNRWGEPEDSIDIYPEVYVGRVLVRNMEEVNNWLQRVLNYERNPGNASLMKDVMWSYQEYDPDTSHMGGNFINFQFLVNQAIAHFPEDYTHYHYYAMSSTENLSGLNEGYGQVCLYAHGWPDRWTTRTWPVSWVFSWPSAGGGDLYHLSNPNKYGVVYSISCMNAMFDKILEDVWHCEDTTIADGFTDAYTNGGEAAFLGNSRYGWSHTSPSLHRCFLDVLFNSSDLSSKVGYAEGISKTLGGSRYVWYSHNLFGSPETPVWTDVPPPLTASHPSRLYVDPEITLLLTVTVTSNGSPVEDALVCLYKPSDDPVIYKRGYTDANGEVTFDLRIRNTGYLYVTATKHNFKPYEGRILCTYPPCPFLYTYNGSEFIEDNNILSGSGTVEDWYKLREKPLKDENRYRLQIKENNDEHSFFDRVRLYAIDHPDSVEVFVTQDGEIVSVSMMSASQSVIGEDGVDYTTVLLDRDSVWVEANEVEKITAEFGGTNGGDYVILAPPGPKPRLMVEEANGSSFETVGSIRGRENPSYEVLPLTVSSPEEVSLRFTFTDVSQRLDYIRFGKRNNAPYHIKPCPLVAATHSDIGSVKQKLLIDDENYAELLPCDTITLEFAVVDIEPGWVRDFVFVSNGYYVTEGKGGSQTAYSSIPLVHSLSLYPNPAKNDMNIRFGIPREEKVSLKIYDVSGREVKMLVDDRLEAGYHIIKLDSENLPSGIYFARLVTNNYEATKKLVLMK